MIRTPEEYRRAIQLIRDLLSDVDDYETDNPQEAERTGEENLRPPKGTGSDVDRQG